MTWPWNAKTLSFRLYNRPISVSFHRVYSHIHNTQFDFINLSQLTFSFSVWTRIGSLGDFQFRLKTNTILVKVLNCSFSRISSTVSFLYWQGGSGPWKYFRNWTFPGSKKWGRRPYWIEKKNMLYLLTIEERNKVVYTVLESILGKSLQIF